LSTQSVQVTVVSVLNLHQYTYKCMVQSFNLTASSIMAYGRAFGETSGVVQNKGDYSHSIFGHIIILVTNNKLCVFPFSDSCSSRDEEQSLKIMEWSTYLDGEGICRSYKSASHIRGP
jgi:hypothetical protein